VVQRFGDIKKLVEQTLDPMVSAYFKNIAQKKTLIELLQERSDIQQQAGEEMRAKFNGYNLELQEVLIGTPRAKGSNDQIEKVLQQLRERQVAEERVTTYEKQRIAAESEKALREAEAAPTSRPRSPSPNCRSSCARTRARRRCARPRSRPSRPACRPRPKATACA
jgi:uncharacterized membrane protein YqiK